MHRKLLFFALLLLVATGLAAESIFPYKYQEAMLDNGLRVITVPMKNAGLVSYFTVVRAGSRDEIEPGKSGFAHFFEHMMFRGTEKYPPDKYNQVVTEMGADMNAYTSDDLTVYYMHFPARYLENVMDLESDRFMKLKYSMEGFQTEAKAILGEYNKNLGNPFFQIEEKLRDLAFDKSSYKHSTMGYLKDIQDMANQYDYSLQFFNRFYRPENCILIITGDFNPQEALANVKKYYSGWKRGNYKTVNFEEPEQTAERRGKIDYSGDTLPILAIGYKAPPFKASDKEFISLYLMGPLAFGETSELYQQLVLKDQLVDLLGPEIDPHRDPYLFNIYARLKKEEDLAKVEQAVGDTLEKFKNTTVDPGRVADLKSSVKYGFLLALDTSKNVAIRLAPYIAQVEQMGGIDTFLKTVDSVTPEDIQKVAKKYFSKEKRTVITLTGAKS